MINITNRPKGGQLSHSLNKHQNNVSTINTSSPIDKFNHHDFLFNSTFTQNIFQHNLNTKDNFIQFATINIAGKFNNSKQDIINFMFKYDIHILGITETKQINLGSSDITPSHSLCLPACDDDIDEIPQNFPPYHIFLKRNGHHRS